MMINLAKLHDASIENISISLEKGIVFMKLLVFDGSLLEKSLTFKEFTNFECPRNMPWGENNDINEVRLTETNHCMVLEIEVQSGDVIRIECEKIIYS